MRRVTVPCTFAGCRETAHYEFRNLRDEARHFASNPAHKYRCVKHTAPERNLSPTNTRTECVLVAERSKSYPELTSLFWNGSNGFVHGPGFKAFTEDFPEGARIRVVATVETPDAREPGTASLAAERARQIEQWGNAHDDEHVRGELAITAADLACYGTDAQVTGREGLFDWGLVEKHKSDRIRQLVIAGALIAAEIDRLRRGAGQ